MPADGTANLIPAKPGEVRNPQGMKPGTLQWKTIAKKLADGTMTVEEAGEKRQITRREVALLKAWGYLLNKDTDPNIFLKALDLLMKREEGNPEQPISGVVSQIVTIPITESESKL